MTGWLPGGQTLLRAIRLLTAIGGGLVVLGVCARALNIGEFEEALRLVRANLARNQES
jgi:hypothetical protein